MGAMISKGFFYQTIGRLELPRWLFVRIISRSVGALILYLMLGLVAIGQSAGVGASGQASSPPPDPGSASAAQNTQSAPDPLTRPLTDKQKHNKALKQELSQTYKRWLNEDVVYIITPEELSAFKQLSNDEERDQFIEQFWLRRDPTPDTPENEYREEHYRRIAEANEKFPAGIPGWRTDRGRIYIIWGPPDEIERHPTGGNYERPMEEGGGDYQHVSV